MSLKIGVVIPCYKVKRHILDVISKIGTEVSSIYVVDDCCPERSGYFVKEHCHDTRVQILWNETNLGVGGASMKGYDAAIEDGIKIIVKVDGDGQMDPNYILDLVTPIREGKADYTKGNRFLHARELSKMPWTRRIGNTGLSFLTKLASGYWNIFDPTNGFTAIHVDALRNLRNENINRRYFFESSMLIELGLIRATVKDIYIPATYNGEASSLSEIDALVEFPWKLLQGFIRRIKLLYFIQDFNATSLLLTTGIPAILFGLVFGTYQWIKSAYYGVPTNTGTVMLAVLPVILGVQFIIQALALDIQNIPSEPLQKTNFSSRFAQKN